MRSSFACSVLARWTAAIVVSWVCGCGPPSEADRPLFHYHRDDNLGNPWSPYRPVEDSFGNVVFADGPRNILVLVISFPEPSSIQLALPTSTKLAKISIGKSSTIAVGPAHHRLYVQCGLSSELAEFDLVDLEGASYVAARAHDAGGNAVTLVAEKAIGPNDVARFEELVRKCKRGP